MKKYLFGEKHYYMYTLETLFDSIVALFISGTFFAKLTTSLGVSDTMTAVLAQSGNLVIGLYLISSFISRSPNAKPIIGVLQLCYQLLVSTIYVLPFFLFEPRTSEILLLVILLVAKGISFVYGGAKSGWYVSNIPAQKRASYFGISSAIVNASLFLVSLLMGRVIDRMEEAGNLKGAFLTIFLIMLAMTALNVTTIFLTRRPSEEFRGTKEDASAKDGMRDLIRNDGFRTITIQRFILTIGLLATTAYQSTYLIVDIGLSMSGSMLFNAIGLGVYAISLAVWGKLGERMSLLKMYEIGLILMASASFVSIFLSPTHYALPYTLYVVLYQCGAAAYGVGYMLTYRIMPERHYPSAAALSGIPLNLTNFFLTLALSPLFDYLKYDLDSTLFGRTFYAQQTFSIIGTVVQILSLAYLFLVVSKNIKKEMNKVGGVDPTKKVRSETPDNDPIATKQGD